MLQELVFKRGNLVRDDHPLPAVAEVSLSVTCSFPASIALLVDEPGTAICMHINIHMTHVDMQAQLTHVFLVSIHIPLIVFMAFQ